MGENAAWIEGYDAALQYLQRMNFWRRVFFLFFWKEIFSDVHMVVRDEVDDIIHEAKERADGACVHCLELRKKGVEPADHPHYHYPLFQAKDVAHGVAKERGGGES